MTTMSTGTRGRVDRRADLAVLLVVLGVTAWGAAVVLGLRRPPLQPRLQPTDALWAGSFSAFLVLGAWIARRQPRNPVGWCLAAGPVCVGLGVAIFEYVLDPMRPAAAWVGLGANPSFGLGMVLLFVWPLWYPDGRLLSRRWRWLLRALAGTYAVSVVTQVLTATPYSAAAPTASPLAIGNGVVDALHGLTGGVLPVLGVTASASLVVRFHRADPRVRDQLKVLVYAVAVVAAAILGLTVATRLVGETPVIQLLGVALVIAALLAVPIAVATAILRHGALDIDRTISRTVGYAVITAIAVGIYAGSVLALGAVARAITGRSSDLVVALSTLVVAALFQPVRRRVQRVVDRRFNRGHVDRLVAAEEFGRRLREEVELGAVVADLRGTVARTLQPATVSVTALSPAGGRP